MSKKKRDKEPEPRKTPEQARIQISESLAELRRIGVDTHDRPTLAGSGAATGISRRDVVNGLTLKPYMFKDGLDYENTPFVRLMLPILFDTSLSASAVRVYCAIVAHCGRRPGKGPEGDRDFAWMGQKSIATRIGVSLSTVEKSVKKLKEKGIIRASRRGGAGGANAYLVYHPAFAYGDLLCQHANTVFRSEPHKNLAFDTEGEVGVFNSRREKRGVIDRFTKERLEEIEKMSAERERERKARKKAAAKRRRARR